jgi:limonene-1,2-epoxide hydrolase
MNAEETVLAFIESWNRLDQERIYALMAEDILYHNMPLEPVRGREAVREHLAAWPVDECEWELLNIAARGNVVLTERVDRFRRGYERIVIPVMGIFEVTDGLITHWRDYFDLRATKPQPPSA